MLKNGILFATMGLLIGISACQSDKEPDFYAAEYFVRYLEAEQKIRAEARIYAGSDATSAQPVPADTIRFRDYEMTSNSKLGKIYQYEAQMPFAQACSFSFNFPESREVHPYVYEMPQVPGFALSDSLGLSKGVFLSWEGSPLSEGESIVLIFEKADRSTAEAIVTGPTAANSIQIPLVQVKGISPGNWSVYLVRKRILQLMEQDHSITAEAAYYTKPISVSFKD